MTFIAREPKKINIRLIRKGKSYEAEEVLRRLRSFLDRNESEPVKILRGFWKDQQDALSYGEIREAILAGHISEQTIREWRQDYAKLVNEQFSHTWKNALAVGYKGQPIMDNLSSFHFDMQKPGVLSWIGERGAEFVTNEFQTTKDAIRGLLMRSVTEKHSVDELSRVIRPLVGLNKPQAYANMRYYENVLNTLSDQHPRTSKEVIQRRAQEAAWKYAEKQHRERAYMIARTEMSFAYNRGAYEGIKQAQELGLMGAVVKIWSTSQGGNVCPDCEALEGEEVGMEDTWGDKFPSRGLFRGDNLVPPLHPRCECAIVYQEVSTKDVGWLKPAYSYDEYDVPEEGFVYDEYKPNEKPVYVDRIGVKADGTRAYDFYPERSQFYVDNKDKNDNGGAIKPNTDPSTKPLPIIPIGIKPSPQIPNKETIEAFKELGNYFKEEYNIKIKRGVYRLNYGAVRDTLKGVEDTIKEFPMILEVLCKIGTHHQNLMGSSGKGIFFSPENYWGFIPLVDSVIEKNNDTGKFHKNISRKSMGVHEAIHCLERLLINKDFTLSRRDKKEAWNTCLISKQMVKAAYAVVSKMPENIGKSELRLRREISKYATHNYSETLAEAFADVYVNGSKATTFSKEIVKQTKLRYAELIKR